MVHVLSIAEEDAQAEHLAVLLLDLDHRQRRLDRADFFRHHQALLEGQVIAPKGTSFVILGDRDVVILKTIAPPALAEFDDLVRRARSAARKAGMEPADVERAVAKACSER